MFPPNHNGSTSNDVEGGETLPGSVVIVSSGEKNSLWFRYVILSIVAFTSQGHHEDHHDQAASEQLDESSCDHVVDLNSDWEKLVQIVKNKDLIGFQVDGGVDWALSLQRPHFEVDNSLVFSSFSLINVGKQALGVIEIRSSFKYIYIYI